MCSWRPTLRRLGIISIPLLVFLSVSADLSALPVDPNAVAITSVGMGAPPPDVESPESPIPSYSAADDARKKAILIYLYEILGREEFFRLEDAVTTLILPEYQKYCKNTEIISIASLPGGDAVVLKAVVTIDTAALASYLENIKKLQPKPEVPRALSTAEKEILISKAQAIYIQAEVASDILLDRLRGIESFLSAQAIFETAESPDGVYRCLMGIGRARASLGDIVAARVVFDRALEVAGELKRPDYAAGVRIVRARLMFTSGDLSGARREIGSVLDNGPPAGYEGITGEALLLAGEIEYADGDYESARTAIDRAIAIFEGLADVKRLTRAHLLRGLTIIAEGDAAGAVTAFKTAKILADKLDDAVSRDKALIGISRAYRTAGDPKSASLYLADALKTARDSGWVVGEIACLCETARVQMDLGDPESAKTSAAAAHELALTQGDPVVAAASLFVLGETLRALGANDDALDALTSCVEISTDIRVVGRDIPFLFFGGVERETAISHVLALGLELGREKKTLPLISAYEGSRVAGEVLSAPPPLSARDMELVRLFRDAAMRAIAAEDVLLDGDFIKVADTSHAEIVRLGDEANRSLSDIRTRIVRESPPLGSFLGMKNDDPAGLARVLPEGAAFVKYLVYGDGSFALVITRRGASVVRLGGGYEEIKTALEKIRDAVRSAGAGSDRTNGEISLAFTEAATTLSSLLVSPILPKLAGISIIGISPATTLPTLPIQALGRYDDDGRFVFLGREYTLLATSSLSPRVVPAPSAPSGTLGRDILIVGYENLVVDEPAGSTTTEESVPEGDDPEGGAVGDENTYRVLHYDGGAPWWEADGRLAVFSRKDVWGASGFSSLEYLSLMSHAPALVVPNEAGEVAVSDFVRAMVDATGGGTILGGYADTVRASAEGALVGGPLDWTLFTLMSDFVSEQK